MKVYNKKHFKEVIRQFETKCREAQKETMSLLANYQPEKDDSRKLVGNEITEFQWMIGMF